MDIKITDTRNSKKELQIGLATEVTSEKNWRRGEIDFKLKYIFYKALFPLNNVLYEELNKYTNILV